MKMHPIDIRENAIHALDPKILAILLKDKTTKKNIIWATDDYASLGSNYTFGEQITIAKIVAWNIWQMDGIKFVVPNSCHDEHDAQLNIFGDIVTNACPGCAANDHSKHNGIYCRIYDWSHNGSVEFYSFIKKGAQNNGPKV